MLTRLLHLVEQQFCKHEMVVKRMPIEGSLDTYDWYMGCIHCTYRSDGVDTGGFRKGRYGEILQNQAVAAA
jgi:hypothetical protein